MGRQERNKGGRERSQARRADAMELRKTGATIRSIALAVGVSERQVRNDIERELLQEAERA